MLATTGRVSGHLHKKQKQAARWRFFVSLLLLQFAYFRWLSAITRRQYCLNLIIMYAGVKANTMAQNRTLPTRSQEPGDNDATRCPLSIELLLLSVCNYFTSTPMSCRNVGVIQLYVCVRDFWAWNNLNVFNVSRSLTVLINIITWNRWRHAKCVEWSTAEAVRVVRPIKASP